MQAFVYASIFTFDNLVPVAMLALKLTEQQYSAT